MLDAAAAVPPGLGGTGRGLLCVVRKWWAIFVARGGRRSWLSGVSREEEEMWWSLLKGQIVWRQQEEESSGTPLVEISWNGVGLKSEMESVRRKKTC